MLAELPASIRSSLAPLVKVRVIPLWSKVCASSERSKPVEIPIPPSVVSDKLTEKVDCLLSALVDPFVALSASYPTTPTRLCPDIVAEAASATPAKPKDPTRADAINSSFFIIYSF